jgi:hypothetical protein
MKVDNKGSAGKDPVGKDIAEYEKISKDNRRWQMATAYIKADEDRAKGCSDLIRNGCRI